jgi:hypothetical protein
MKRTLAVVLPAAVAAFLAGCGEKPQVAGSPAQDGVAGNTVTSDAKPWEGAALPFQSGNFNRGDEAGWRKALETRMQGQNEYIRIGGGAR